MSFCTIFPADLKVKTVAAMEAMARQPEAAGDIRTSLILALAYRSLNNHGLLVAFLLLETLVSILLGDWIIPIAL